MHRSSAPLAARISPDPETTLVPTVLWLRSLRFPKLWIRFIVWTINVQNNPITATFHTSQFFDPGVANVPDFRLTDNVVRTIPEDLQNENPITRGKDKGWPATPQPKRNDTLDA